MKSKYSVTMELLFQEHNISYEKSTYEQNKNIYLVMFPSKYVKQNRVSLMLDDSGKLIFCGTLPSSIRLANQTKLLRAINQLNCEVSSFTAFIDTNHVYKDDGSPVLAFSRADELYLYDDTSKALVNTIALIQYLEEYMDMYIERVRELRWCSRNNMEF